MGPKRNHNAVTAGDDNELSYPSSNKRRREQQPSKPKQVEGKPDPTYGQRTAFPGLDDDGSAQFSDDDLEFEQNAEALAYLRAVRAPTPSTAASTPTASATHEATTTMAQRRPPQSLFRFAHRALPAPPRPPPPNPVRIGHCQPCRGDHGTEVGSFGANSWTFRVWTKRIRHTDPLPAQIAALKRQSVLKLLRVILGGKFIRRGYELRPRTSRWIWALLARLPDQGEMDYVEVGWVRELGKRAVLMMVSIAHMDALREEVEGDLEGNIDGDDEEEFVEEMVLDEDGEEHAISTSTKPQPPAAVTTDADNGEGQDGEMDMDIDEGEVTDDDAPSTAGNKDIAADIAAAKARLLARLEENTSTQQEKVLVAAHADTPEDRPNGSSDEETATMDEAEARANMRATLNMVLTVAGEFYGQRDLLEFRDPFPAL
ncbi:hypothetical protein CHGG_06253 [Chaetomium globosum CBS 148.51]|uniref:Uncharacterized protein n=1 Tax=Chaetomium globosum (strain ATCC 6205 / CBS 148.51 / DSM 1962 / NBRC 6347 / NRRL 1970) TaxID=306901 RepID=Q2H512_CHAGB|nr:uncharacterized protein CHGG_06253 [Chaetomium globosum CBS 148.51]EAQ89634.1 hypothetical protein CHGG_06253 [Chaetomium globosum CBS 148.51]